MQRYKIRSLRNRTVVFTIAKILNSVVKLNLTTDILFPVPKFDNAIDSISILGILVLVGRQIEMFAKYLIAEFA